MKTKSIEWWNRIPKDTETQTTAAPQDLCVLINGVAFLIQTQNGWNNVVCIRVRPSKKSILQTFETFRTFCEKNKIQFFRVEGMSHTYKMLYLVCRLGRKRGADCDVKYDPIASAEYDRHIYYVKSY